MGENPSVMIWGGTRGLGRELALLAAWDGWDVFVSGRNPEKTAAKDPELAAAVREIVRADFSYEKFNARDPEVTTASREFMHHGCRADLLVLCAGTYLREPFPDSTEQTLLDKLYENVVSQVVFLRYLLDHRLKIVPESQPPRLLLVSSTTAWKVRDDGQAVYALAKAGMAQFAKCLEAEGAVGRTTIAYPCGMNTEFCKGTDVDPSGFANSADVASHIWRRVNAANHPACLEIKFDRADCGLTVLCTPIDPLLP